MMEGRPKPNSLLRYGTPSVLRKNSALQRYPWWKRRKFLVTVVSESESSWCDWSEHSMSGNQSEEICDVPLEPAPVDSVVEIDALPVFPPENEPDMNPFGISISTAYNAAEDKWNPVTFISAKIISTPRVLHRNEWAEVHIRVVDGINIESFLGIGVVDSTVGNLVAAFFLAEDGGRIAADAESIFEIVTWYEGTMIRCFGRDLVFAKYAWGREYDPDKIYFTLSAKRSGFESMMKKAENIPRMSKMVSTTVEEVEYGDQG